MNTQEHSRGDLAVIKSGSQVAAIVPTNTGEVMQLAKMIVGSGMAPKGMDRPEKAAVAIIAGMEAGLNPMQSLNNIAVINGRPAMWGDAVLALVQASKQLVDIEETITGSGEQPKDTSQ